MSAYDRGQLIFKFANLIEEHADELADLESQDNGKPLSFSRNVDITLAIKVYRYYAGWCDKINGSVIPISGDYMCYTKQEPVGIVG
jgi:aldehyde dehydrogenase (NAD+)